MLIRHPDFARGNDLYEMPEVATLALLAVESAAAEESWSHQWIAAPSARCCAAPVTQPLKPGAIDP